MHVSIAVTIFLLIPSAVEMSEAMTGQFRLCFLPEWCNASQIRVSCQKENYMKETQIAQYCNDSTICRKMNKSGVSLEKDHDKLCLTITNDSYDSCFCEAKIFLDDDHEKNATVEFSNFTVDFNQTNTSPSVFATDASPSQETDDNSPSQDPTNTSTSTGLTDASPSSDNKWETAAVAATVLLVLFILVLLGLWIYPKVKSCRKKTGHLNSRNQDIEMEERGEISAIPDDRVRCENEVLGEDVETLENRDPDEKVALRADEETLEFGQNGRQERRKNLNR